MPKKINKSEIQSTDLVISINNNRLNFAKASSLFIGIKTKYPSVNLYIDEVNMRIAFEFLRAQKTGCFSINATEEQGYYVSSSSIFDLDWVIKSQAINPNKFLLKKIDKKWVVNLGESTVIDESKIVWLKIKNGSTKTDEKAIKIGDRIGFSRQLVNSAQLEIKKFFKIYVDEGNQKLKFEFIEFGGEGAFKITGNKDKGFYNKCESVLKLRWVQKSKEEKNSWLAIKDNKAWIVDLNPKRKKTSPIFWQQIKKEVERHEMPQITINKNRVGLSRDFVKEAEIQNKKFLTLTFDTELRKINFQFSENDAPGAIKVRGNWDEGFYISGRIIYDKEWISNISKTTYNTFEVKKIRNKWEVSIAPTFENSINRSEISKIPNNVCGIYRYMDKGEIVYIGKGQIRKRFNRKDRENWIFDEIQYSIVGDNDTQFYWEKFWIKNFKSQNIVRPRYNKNDGVKND
jgi:hypothetical protein